VAEGARLESVYTFTGIGGSNPSLSASIQAMADGEATRKPGRTSNRQPLLKEPANHFSKSAFHRTHASWRAFLLASLASGASPARMKPCPAPS
jgi:hypothetical protein